ncbi:MAG: Gfo/Idh/MocA family oxidoreductase [Verrucomicrobiota bacterium]
MKNKFRFGLIGAGGIAKAYAGAFNQSDRAALVSVADVNEAAAQELADSVGGRAFSSHEQMLRENNLDAVLICTPPNSHPHIAADALRHGLHVLCEKPLSIRSEQARLMAQTAKENGRILTMASKFRCVADVTKAKEIVESGELGEIILFENAFTSFVDMSQRWNSNKEVSGGGVLIDNGTHSLDISRYILGPLAEIDVVEGRRTQGLEVEETVNIFAKSESGVLANIDLSWTINKSLDYYIRIFGSEGELFIGWKESRLRRNGGDWEVIGSGYDKTAAFLTQIENFAGAIRGEEELLITAEDGIASVEAVEAAYRALGKKEWQSVGDLNAVAA